jgi:TPR repeat protein
MRCDYVLWKDLQRRAWDNVATAAELNELALAYDTGRGCIQNSTLAFKYMLAAADKGNIVSMATVATVVETQTTLNAACVWWHKAAVAGLAEAQRKMGEICIANNEISKGVYWYTLSDRNGDSKAKTFLVCMNGCKPST